MAYHHQEPKQGLRVEEMAVVLFLFHMVRAGYKIFGLFLVRLVVTDILHCNIYSNISLGQKKFLGIHCDTGLPAGDMSQALHGNRLRLFRALQASLYGVLMRDARVTMVPSRLKRFLNEIEMNEIHVLHCWTNVQRAGAASRE